MNDDVTFLSALPLWFWGCSAFLMSACVGSFLNVVAARVPRRQSIVWPGSHCFTCGAPIAARHNIPILSWFILRGHCHQCRASFSIRYALVELGFALLCTYSVLRAGGPTFLALRECLFYSFLFPLACIDLDTWTLPDQITVPGIVVGLLLSAVQGFDVLIVNALCAGFGYAILRIGGFIGTYILKKEAMGGGDFMLFALIGAFMGPKALLPVIFLSSLQGSLVGLAMIGVRKFEFRRRENNRLSGLSPEVKKLEAEESAAELKDVSKEALSEADESQEESQNDSTGGMVESLPTPTEAQKAAVERILRPKSMNDLRTFACKLPDDGWRPDAHALPFGPFLALASVELVVFRNFGSALFPL